jgi:hypothetical protein
MSASVRTVVATDSTVPFTLIRLLAVKSMIFFMAASLPSGVLDVHDITADPSLLTAYTYVPTHLED